MAESARSDLPSALLSVFFFQAEDGIRDRTVTGVQTCALPISHRGPDALTVLASEIQRRVLDGESRARDREMSEAVERSEERRVGKEGRCRGPPDLTQKNDTNHKA